MRERGILLVGPFRRQRVGGIRSHVVRLDALLRSLGLATTTCDPKSADFWRYWFAAWGKAVVHIHNSNGLLTAAMVAWARLVAHRVVVTIHGNLQDFSPASRAGFVAAGRLGASTVALNPTTANWLAAHGVASTMQSAFLPPLEQERALKAAATEVALGAITRFRTGFRKCFLTYVNYGRLSLVGDVYGIRQLLALFDARPDDALIVLVSAEPAELRAEIGDRPNVLLIVDDVHVPALFGGMNALLRNSESDGDSVLVQEALASALPVLATDVVARPQGCRIYRKDDMSALAALLDEAGQDAAPSADETARLERAAADILRLYGLERGDTAVS